MQHIETVTVGAGGAASITFSAIPDTFTDLLLVVSARASSNYGNVEAVFDVNFNGVSTNRSQRTLYGQGTTAVSTSYSALYNWNTSSSATSNTFSNVSIYIPNYGSSSAKSISLDGVTENNGTNAFLNISAGLWNSTSPITSITLVDSNAFNLVQYSSASLFGITAGSDGIVSVS